MSRVVDRAPRLPTYKAAHAHFTKTPAGRRSKNWAENERPLDTKRENQIKLVLNEDGSYCMRHYNTDVARYFPPDASGKRTLLLRGYPSASTRTLLYRSFFRVWDTVPLNWHVEKPYNTVPEDWSARLVFDKDETLLVSESEHRPVYKRVSSPDVNARRQAFLRHIEPIMSTMEFAYPKFLEDAKALVTDYRVHTRVDTLVARLCLTYDEDAGFADAATEWTELAVYVIARIGYIRGWDDWDVLKKLKWSVVATAIKRRFITALRLDAKTVKVALPPFTKLPQRYSY